MQKWLKINFNDCVRDDECLSKDILGAIKTQYNLFCGHDEWCLDKNNVDALAEAKSNVERFYSVVGLTEDFEKTFLVLEQYLPRFFKGSTRLYRKEYANLKVNVNQYDPILQATKSKFSKLPQIIREIDFYDFVSQRLEQQYRFITKL